eukprot:jgi/Botrbrau1/22667/Bobra.0132s0013.1
MDHIRNIPYIWTLPATLPMTTQNVLAICTVLHLCPYCLIKATVAPSQNSFPLC